MKISAINVQQLPDAYHLMKSIFPPSVWNITQTHKAFVWPFVAGIAGVEIRHMQVPKVVESGTLPFVILDCNYDMAAAEGNQVDVKWFFNDDPQPFYQWIPGRPPQAIGELFKNKLDLNYAVEGGDR